MVGLSVTRTIRRTSLTSLISLRYYFTLTQTHIHTLLSQSKTLPSKTSLQSACNPHKHHVLILLTKLTLSPVAQCFSRNIQTRVPLPFRVYLPLRLRCYVWLFVSRRHEEQEQTAWNRKKLLTSFTASIQWQEKWGTSDEAVMSSIYWQTFEASKCVHPIRSAPVWYLSFSCCETKNNNKQIEKKRQQLRTSADLISWRLNSPADSLFCLMFKMSMNSIGSALETVRSQIAAAVVRRPSVRFVAFWYHSFYEHRISKNFKRPVELVAVSKLHSVQSILEAYSCGQRVFGENYVEELYEKANDAQITNNCPDIRWHFIGHCQSKKAKKLTGETIHASDHPLTFHLTAIPNLDMMETIDSEKIATAIEKCWQNRSDQLKVLVQVNTSQEESEYITYHPFGHWFFLIERQKWGTYG